MHRLNPGMLVLGIAIILVALFLGSFVHPVLFLIGLSVIIVYFIGGE
jgi:hypothetical protein